MGASCEVQAAGSMHVFFSVIIVQNYQSGIMAHLSSSSYRKSGSGGGLVRTLDLGVSIIAVSIQNPGRYLQRKPMSIQKWFSMKTG